MLRPGGRLVMLSPSRQLLLQVLQQQAHLWTDEQNLDVNCGGSLACLVLWQRTHTPAELPATRTASGTTLDEPASDTLSQWGGGEAEQDCGGAAADARDIGPSSLLRRILRCEAPAADCALM